MALNLEQIEFKVLEELSSHFMKKIGLTIISLIFFSCAKEKEKCSFQHSDKEMAIYNDVLIEMVEHFFYNRYLGDEWKKVKTDGMDSVQIAQKQSELQKLIFGDSLKYRNVFLVDTVTEEKNLKFDKMDDYDGLDKLAKELSSNKTEILSSINVPKFNYKAKEFHSCTFNVKSITAFEEDELKNEIGIVNFSKVFINQNRDEGVLCCNFRCGGLCGRGYILRIKKNGNRWKIVEFHTTWIS
jgi:hypothetical protein